MLYFILLAWLSIVAKRRLALYDHYFFLMCYGFFLLTRYFLILMIADYPALLLRRAAAGRFAVRPDGESAQLSESNWTASRPATS